MSSHHQGRELRLALAEAGSRRAQKTADRRARCVEAARKDPEVTTSQLAERFGVARHTVHGWLVAAGVPVSSFDLAGCYVSAPRAKRRAAR